LHNARMTACVVAAGLLVAACAQPGADGTETATSPTPVDIDVVAPTWGDDFDHVVVYAADGFARNSTADMPVVSLPRSADTAQTAVGDGPRSVYRTNGRIDIVEFPPDALVVDARWALFDERIVELGTATAESSTSSSRTDSAPDSWSANSVDELPAPGSFSGDSAAFVDMLADIDGVESATFVMPGVAAVALSGSVTSWTSMVSAQLSTMSSSAMRMNRCRTSSGR